MKINIIKNEPFLNLKLPCFELMEKVMVRLNKPRMIKFKDGRKVNLSQKTIIPLEKASEIVRIRPSRLLSHKRFDIMAKFIYAKHRELCIDSNWAKSLYDEHIRVLTIFWIL